MKKIARGGILAGAGLALSVALAGVVFAQEEQPDPLSCAMTCRDTKRDCRFDARDARVQCLEEAACDGLRDAYRAACRPDEGEVDEEACASARDAFRDCVTPCRDDFRGDFMDCRNDLRLCLAEDCGLMKRPHLRPHRHSLRHPPFRHPRPFRPRPRFR